MPIPIIRAGSARRIGNHCKQRIGKGSFAEVAMKIGVFFQHRDIDAGASEEKSRH